MKSMTLSIAMFGILLLAGAAAVAAPKGGIPDELVKKLISSKMDGSSQVIADIVANKDITEVALNRERYLQHNKLVNFKIKTGDISNQKSSGRCWLFAAMNVLRPQVMKKYKVKNFEFSLNYLMFWDKMEKANFFLQGMTDLADRPNDDRELEILKKDPFGDGGWWTYFVDLVDKYGVVPKEIMPETHNSSSSGRMNDLIGMKVMEMGIQLRAMAKKGASAGELENQKTAMLTEVYRFLVINLGQPPAEFSWRYESTDTTGSYPPAKKYTAQSFYKEAIGEGLHDYVAIFDYPGKERFNNYSLSQSRNLYDRPDFVILNMPVDTLKAYAFKSVLDSTPVWFACDVGRENYNTDAIMATGIYDYEKIFGTTFQMPKAELIYTGLITPNHAMAFIGVDTLDGKPQKWLVENSWGGERGDKGYWYMYNDWFDRYMFGVIIHKKYLSKEILALADKKPIVLPPWDPMYALNRLQ